MTRIQSRLMNCYVRWMKEWLKSYNDTVYNYELTGWSLSVKTKKSVISWSIMEKMKDVAKNTSWQISFDESGLIIKFWK